VNLSGWYAGPSYELLRHKGLPSAKLHEASSSVGNRVGYHLRVGKHDILLEDWNHFADFASRWLGRP
ncbi:MAG: acetylxylan esterase, partial [Pirellulaceae bacterium]